MRNSASRCFSIVALPALTAASLSTLSEAVEAYAQVCTEDKNDEDGKAEQEADNSCADAGMIRALSNNHRRCPQTVGHKCFTAGPQSPKPFSHAHHQKYPNRKQILWRHIGRREFQKSVTSTERVLPKVCPSALTNADSAFFFLLPTCCTQTIS